MKRFKNVAIFFIISCVSPCQNEPREVGALLVKKKLVVGIFFVPSYQQFPEARDNNTCLRLDCKISSFDEIKECNGYKKF
jgi:hypothetical protein